MDYGRCGAGCESVKGQGLIKQILLTALVTLAVVLIVQARRRAGRVSKDAPAASGVSPQAIAGWALLAVMLAAAIGAAFLHNG